MFKRCLTLAALGLFVACSETPTEPTATTGAPDVVADYGSKPDTPPYTYEITIYNLTEGQPLTPPLVATHKAGLKVFRPGSRASEGVKEIAENGNTAPLTAALESHDKVHAVAMAGAPVLPGGSLTFTVEGAPGARKLSWVSMLICTNDGFTGLAGLRLPHKVGAERYRYVRAWDAGTEINTENFTHMVPPCPLLTGIDTDEMGTGMSDPALAQNGRIRRHRGIRGRDDLLPRLHGWQGPVAKIFIRRIS